MNIREILSYGQIILKWWWVIVLLFVTTVGTMFLVSVMSETRYESSVTVQVSAPPPQEVPLFSQFGRDTGVSVAIEETRRSFAEFLQAGDAAWRTLDVLPDVSLTGTELRERMVVELPDNSQLMRITVPYPNPDIAALLANTLVEKGLEGYGELLAKPTANNRAFIEQQLQIAQAELADAESELVQAQMDNKIGDLNRAIDTQYDLLSSLRLQLDLASANREVVKVRGLENVIEQREAELQELLGFSSEYATLTDRVERLRDTYSFMLDKSAEAQIKENQILELGSIQVITPARPAADPSVLINSRIIFLGAVVSLLLGVLLTFVLEGLEVAGVLRGVKPPTGSSDSVATPV
ncbi:MAG TPA: hypothetical protein PKE64_00760 [Anaerolineae bacterium]|nr:hypothetical protein [Anaerolineae bacterium]HMR62517.1 hypothetical protein [Anaerolineae bacterium]